MVAMTKQRKASPGYENWLVWYRRSDPEDRYFKVFEKNADGTVTHWTLNFGQTGTLTPEALAATKPVTTKKERDWVDHTKRMIQRGIDKTDAQYTLLKMQRDLSERGL